MENPTIFSLKRFYLLSRRQILSNTMSLLIAFGAVAGVLLIISLLVAYFNPENLNNLTGLYFAVMFIGGYIFSSNMFNELHTAPKSYNYLTLPVSTTERLVSAWAISAFLFPAIALIAMALMVFLANLIMNLTLDLAPFQGIFSRGSFQAVKVYFITQSVFLLGAAYFRKNNFLKTLLALFVISMIINIYMGITGYIMFSEWDMSMQVNISEDGSYPAIENLFLRQIPAVASFVFNYVTVPFFLVTTWFSLKERQV